MQSVSAEYLEQIVASERKIVAEAVIDFVDNAILGAQITVTADEKEAGVTDKENAKNAVRVLPATKRWAFADPQHDNALSRVKPADDLYPIPTNEEVGWWGDTASNASTGAIAGGETLEYDYGVATDIGFVGWWADDYLAYPVDFEVEYYTTVGGWQSLVAVAGNASASWRYELASELTIEKLRIRIDTINRPGSVAKLIEFDAGFSVTVSDRIVRFDILKEREHSGATTPVGNVSSNRLTLVLDNSDGVFYRNSGSIFAPYLISNRRISISIGLELADGSIEELAQGTFYSISWKSSDKSLDTTVEAWDRSKLLKDRDYEDASVQVGMTISELVALLATDFGIDVADQLISTTTDVVPYAYFTPKQYWSHIRDLAEGEGGAAYFDEYDRLVFESRDYLAGKTTVVATLTDEHEIVSVDEDWSQSNMRNRVTVKSKALTPDTQQQVASIAETITVPGSGTKSITIFFSQSPCINVQTPSITGDPNVSIDSWTQYSWGGQLVLINASGSDETVTLITVDAQPLVQEGGIRPIAEDAVLISQNGTRNLAIENAFIQSLDQAQSLADDLLATYKDPGNRYKATGPGRPELQLADRVAFDHDRMTISGDYWITSIKLSYDGGLDQELELLEAS